MPLTIGWRDVVLRLFVALVAGAVVGVNRSEQGHAAGLRTTVLVCLAAAGAMIQVNLLMTLAEQKQSLVELDLMRLPLGILSGMGFIGGGAILKRGDIVHGVTTAATLWFVTVMGLCLGGGQLALGLELLALALFVLWGLRELERRLIDENRATITLTLSDRAPHEGDIRKRLAAANFEVIRCAIDRDAVTVRCSLELDVRWRAATREEHSPPIVAELAAEEGVLALKWEPKR